MWFVCNNTVGYVFVDCLYSSLTPIDTAICMHETIRDTVNAYKSRHGFIVYRYEDPGRPQENWKKVLSDAVHTVTDQLRDGKYHGAINNLSLHVPTHDVGITKLGNYLEFDSHYMDDNEALRKKLNKYGIPAKLFCQNVHNLHKCKYEPVVILPLSEVLSKVISRGRNMLTICTEVFDHVSDVGKVCAATIDLYSMQHELKLSSQFAYTTATYVPVYYDAKENIFVAGSDSTIVNTFDI